MKDARFTHLLRSMAFLSMSLLAFGGAACSGAEANGTASSVGEAKTTWTGAAEGSCEAGGMLRIANDASFEVLDDEVGLDKRAAENIVAARPLASLAELDDVSYVGHKALDQILAFASAKGELAMCGGAEIGIISDLDKTVIPHSSNDLSLPPYPGVATLYQTLELGAGGEAGDMYYVTARKPERVEDIPAYLEMHGVPTGPIETGTSGIPWIAQPEKVKDVTKIMDSTGEQSFVLFGDSSQADPEVYQEIRAAFPERVVAAFIHRVTDDLTEERVEGMYAFDNYAEVAAVLFGLGVISRDEALGVMRDAQSEGLEISEEEMEALLAAQPE